MALIAAHLNAEVILSGDCCGMQSHKYTRGKRKRSNHLLVSLSAIAEDKNEGNQNIVS